MATRRSTTRGSSQKPEEDSPVRLVFLWLLTIDCGPFWLLTIVSEPFWLLIQPYRCLTAPSIRSYFPMMMSQR
jgi:hypothetical protein